MHRAAPLAAAALAAVALAGCSSCDGPKTTSTSGPVPSTVDSPRPLRAVSVACGRRSSWAVMSDGTVRAWGDNHGGGLGAGDPERDAATPLVVEGLSGVLEVAAGGNGEAQVACARLADGGLRCWGAGTPPLPLADPQPQPAPIDIPALGGTRRIALGDNGTACAATTEGRLLCWGQDAFGRLGLGSADSSEVRGPTLVPELEGVVEVAPSQNHTCALLAGGTVRCWGRNVAHAAHPTLRDEVLPHPTDVGVTGATHVATANAFSCAITARATLCWGAGFGEGPRPVDGFAGAEGLAGRGHSLCALMRDGAVRCLGQNAWGELGNGTRTASHAPVNVAGLASARSLSVGDRHACAVVQDGSVWCWGYNQRGALGDGTLRDSPTPVEVSHLGDAVLPPAADGFDAVGQSALSPDLAGAPPGCRNAPVALGAQGATQPALGVKSAYALPTGGALLVSLADYFQEPSARALLGDGPRGPQRALRLELGRSESAGVVGVGRYETASDERRVKVGLATRRGIRPLFESATTGDAGTVELTYASDTWICGDVSLGADVDPRTGGSFAARLIAP